MSDNITNLSVGIGADTAAFNAAINEVMAIAAGLKDIKVKITPEIVGGTKKGVVDVPVKVNTKDAKEKLAEFKAKIREIEGVAGNKNVAFKVETDGLDKIKGGVISYTNAMGQAVRETYKLTNVLDEAGEVAGQSFELIKQTFSDNAVKAKAFEEALRAVKIQLDAFVNKNADIATKIGVDKLREEFAALEGNTNASSADIKSFTNSLNEAKAQAAAIRAEMAQQEAAIRSAAQAEREATAATIQRRQENENIQNVISKFAHSADTSLMTELRQQTAEYQKHVAILRQRIALERSSGSNKAATVQDRLQKSALKTTYHYARLVSYGKSFAQQMQKTYNSMSGIQGYARSTANIVKGILISQVFYNALGALKQMVSEAANLNIELEATEAVLTGMFTGGQEQARELLEILKSEAINTPFDVQNLTQATRLLTAYGIKAENLLYTMRAVEQATAASGDPQKMERISRAIGQIHTKGKLTAKEVRQLTEAGVAVGEILQKELGLTQAQLGEGWAKLNIDATTALNALVKGINERYGTALDNMQVTTQQKLANAKEAFQLLGAEMAKPFLQAVGGVLDKVIGKLDTFYKAVRAVGLGNALKTLVPSGIYDAVTNLVNKVVTGVQVIKYTFNSLRPVISAVLGTMSYYGNVIYNAFLLVSSALSAFGLTVGNSAGGVAQLTAFLMRLAGAALFVRAAMFAAAVASKVWGAVTLVFKGVMAAANVMAGMIAALPMVFGAAASAAAAPWVAVAGVLLGVAAIAAGLVGKFQEVKAAIGGVKDAFKNITGGTNIKDMFTDLGTGLNKKIDEYNKKLEEDQEKFNQEFTGSGKAIEDSVDGAASKTKKAMEGLMSFDEVYKLTEAAAAGGAGRNDLLDDLDYDKIADFIGGAFKPDMFNFGKALELDLKPLEDAFKNLIEVLDLKRMAIYAAKVAGFFFKMYMLSKSMTVESGKQTEKEKTQTIEDGKQTDKEKTQTIEDGKQTDKEKTQTIEDGKQTDKEKTQTVEDGKQTDKEKTQTVEDGKQTDKEKTQTVEDGKQTDKEKTQTIEDGKQTDKEKTQTIEDGKQTDKEKTQTIEDGKQTDKEKTQTIEDGKQTGKEKSQTVEDGKQLTKEKQQTAEDAKQASRAGGRGAGAGRRASIASAGFMTGIDVMQLGMSGLAIGMSAKELKEKKASGEEITWQDYTPLIMDISLGIMDIIQLVMSISRLIAAIKMGKAVAGGVSAIGKGASLAGSLGGGAMSAAGGGGIMAALGPVMGPVLGIAAAAAAIAAILYIIVKWGPQIIEFLQGLFTAIGNLAKDLATAVATIIVAIGEAYAAIIGAFLGGIADIIKAYSDGIAKVIQAITQGIVSVINALGENIVNLINAFMGGVANIVSSFFSGLDRLASHLDPLISAIAVSIVKLSSALASPLNALGDILRGMAKVINVIADNLPNWINRLITAIGKISINVAMPGGSITNHARGGVFKKGTGLVVNAATTVGSNRYGEAGAEAVIPLERSSVIDMFAERIAISVAPLIPEAASKMSSQFAQAKQTAAMGGSLIPSATEIAGAIKSFLTPQLQAVVDALAQIEPIQVNNPMFLDNQGARKLTEKLESVRDSMGSRGRVGSKFVTV